MPLTVLAMSGGVDSSVSARLLLDQGHELVGVFMRHGSESPLVDCSVSSAESNRDLHLPIINDQRLDHKQGCCSASDAEDARHIAEKLGIPFYALNLQKEFDRIINYFVDEYRSGRTPNPCVMCNNWIKFGKLFDYADSIGAQFVATGHYARLENGGDEFQLVRGVDSAKDQSYVLFGIQRHLLRRMLLPVGEYSKAQIRSMAVDLGMRVADKKDSQEICFVTSGKHAEFIAERDPGFETAGKIVTTDGSVVGEHDGIERYTIGQRRGIGVAMGEPHFVVRIDVDSNTIVIGKREELGRTELTACRTNWLSDIPDGVATDCQAQIRYNSKAVPAILTTLPGQRMQVAFNEPCYGVAPGQAVVCYDGERVLGGGWIE